MKTTLNTKTLDAATPGGKPCLDMFDAMTPGLCLRVTSAKKSWCFVFTPPGGTSRTRMAFGTYPATSLKDARTRAEELRGQVEKGTDPRETGPVDRPKTIAELIEERLSLELRGKKRRAADTEYRFNKFVIPLIGNVPVKDFKIDPHYNKVVDPIIARGKMRMAGLVYQDLNSLFRFALQRGTIEFTQMTRVKRPDKYKPCERFLSEEEIKTLWASLPTATRSPTVQAILRLLLVTGQRLQEVAGITRQEIDLEKAVWNLPAARSKNGTAHAVPLSALAIALLRKEMRETNGDFLFPSKTGEGPRSSRDIDSSLNYGRSRGRFGVTDWTPHDLRRTVATHMSRMGIPHGHISHVLNHVTNTRATITQAVYDKHDFMPEKREALDKWGAFLAKLVGVETGLRVAA